MACADGSICGGHLLEAVVVSLKTFLSLLFFPALALPQSPASEKRITFNRADTEHCKVILVGGKPLLESSYGGTTVAISMPVNMANGEFAVFVLVSQVGQGAVDIAPQEFYALYSDPAHTRFPFYDQAAEIEKRERAMATASGTGGANSQIDMGMLGGPRGGVPRGAAASSISAGNETPPGQPPTASSGPVSNAPGSSLLTHSTVKQGASATGWVFFAKPKQSKLTIGPTDMLDEIDIRVAGVTFRF